MELNFYVPACPNPTRGRKFLPITSREAHHLRARQCWHGRLGHPVMFISAGTAGPQQQNLPGPSWASSFKDPAGLWAVSQAPLTPCWCKEPQKHPLKGRYTL